MANPNRVRALIGSFAQANHTQFNRADGAGYEFVADIVLALDPKNPQVAARLMGAFRSWRALEAGRRARAEATLAPRRRHGRRCRGTSPTSSPGHWPKADPVLMKRSTSASVPHRRASARRRVLRRDRSPQKAWDNS